MSEALPDAHEEPDEDGGGTEVAASDEEEFIPKEEDSRSKDNPAKGVFKALIAERERREEAGENPWIELDPPTDEQQKESPSIIGNWQGKPIKSGFMIKNLTDEQQKEKPWIIQHRVYRTAKYNVHFRVREITDEESAEIAPVGTTDEKGRIELTVPDVSPAAGELNVVARKLANDKVETGYYSSDGQIDGETTLKLDVEGDIEAGSDVVVTVRDADGNPVPGAEIEMAGPVKLATGEVYVRVQDSYR